jgi:hypothetical protein
MAKMTRLTQFFLSTLVAFGLSSSLNGCGYNLRGDTRPFFQEHNIHTLYVAPVKNDSYKAGVEITVYNSLRKRFARGGYVQLVDSPVHADAQITAEVIDASYAPQAITTTDRLPTVGQPGPSFVLIAASYGVNLTVNFELIQLGRVKKTLWKQGLTRAQNFQATEGLGPYGSTAALINESEFERLLSDLSVSVVTDAEESINTLF